MAKIQKEVAKLGKRNAASQAFHVKNDKDKIATWRQDLYRILHVFNVRSLAVGWRSIRISFQTELAIDTHMLAVNNHRNMLAGQGDVIDRYQPVSTASYLLSTRH